MSTLFTKTRLRALALLLGMFVVLFAALQFVRPTLTNPPVMADLQAPADVKTILKTSCYNCHSNETRVPWFDKIVPAYWLVVRDVKRGRMHMNFSNFAKMSPAQQKGLLYEAVNQVQLGAMPPANYLFVHPEARVTVEELDTLKKYLHPPDADTFTPSPVSAAESMYVNQQELHWSTRDVTATPAKIAPAPNGLAFFPDYADWKPVSTTDRFDNSTFRVILGNDVAQRAIAANNIHPWPDGTTFAKIAWKQRPDSSGMEHNGQILTDDFYQVEFMTKDATKYATTEGWGFGRWRAGDFKTYNRIELKPYGENANFTTECTSCHRPMQANDFVFTMPIHDPGVDSDLFSREAALPGNLPCQPLQWRVLTSLSNKKDHTMSTLYGNDAAIAYYRQFRSQPPAPGIVLALVTWNQKDDQHWFGGRIPGKPSLVEFVTGVPAPIYNTYERYEGPSLQKVTDVSTAVTQDRVGAITSMKAAVMP